MYRASARISSEREHAAVVALSEWAQRSRAFSPIVFVVAGITAGMFVLDQISEWAHVYVLLYGSLGLGAGFLFHRFVGLPLIGHRLRRRAWQLAADVGLEADAIEAPARAYLV